MGEAMQQWLTSLKCRILRLDLRAWVIASSNDCKLLPDQSFRCPWRIKTLIVLPLIGFTFL